MARTTKRPGDPLGPLAAKQEGDREGDCCRGVADVVDHVGEERDAVGEHDEDRYLGGGGEAEDEEREPDGDESLAGAFDRRVDESVRVPVNSAVTVVVVLVVVPVVVVVELAVAVRVAVWSLIFGGYPIRHARARAAGRSSSGKAGVAGETCSWWWRIAASMSTRWWSWRR